MTFRSAHELRRQHLIAGFIGHAHQHFHARPGAIIGVGRHDGLLVQLEAVFLERALQALQPEDLAGVTGPGTRPAASRRAVVAGARARGFRINLKITRLKTQEEDEL